MDQITLVKVTLQEAHELDLLARELRRKAGHLLAELRETRKDWSVVCDLDHRTAVLLVQIACGAEVRTPPGAVKSSRVSPCDRPAPLFFALSG